MIDSDINEESDSDVRPSTQPPGDTERTNFPQRFVLRVLERVFSIEFVAFIQTFSYGLHSVIRTNLMIEKSCRVNLNFSSAVCDDIESHSEESDLVQEEVTNLNLYFTFLSAIPCILISLIIGPLADRHGRRPLLLIPNIGWFTAQAVYLLNVYYWEASADYILLSAVYCLFGGTTTFLIGLYSYLADISTPETRTSRVSVLDVAIIVGFTAGNYLSAPLYESLGFYGTFGISMALYALNFLFILLFLKESRKEELAAEVETEPDCSSKILDIFRTVLGRREGYSRAVILSLLALMLLYVATGAADVNYLFTRKMFNWTEAKYTEVTTGVMVLKVVTSLLLVPALSYQLRVEDTTLGVLATLSMLAGTLTTAFSTTGTFYITASCLGLLSPQVSTVIRSLLSKVVQESQLGKVYTLLGCLEAAIPLLASPVLTEVYNNTLETFPGAVFLIQAAFMVVDLILFLVVAGLRKIDISRYSQLQNL